MILIVGFLAVTSRASIWEAHETAEPSGAAPYYRDATKIENPILDPENVEGIYFGVEIDSTHLCGPPTFAFDITSTYEYAITPTQSAPDHIYWYRNQSRVFNSSNTPWGTAYANITSGKDYNWDHLERNPGFPWSGTETHYRHDDQGRYVVTSSNVKRWKTVRANNLKYLCPYEYKTSSTYRYNCESGTYDYGDLIDVKDSEAEVRSEHNHHFADPDFRDDAKLIYSRQVVETGVWHDCIMIL